MPSRIRVLPPEVANQIAAGEVVERPASIVKELVENALDAGAKKIEVEIDEGGRRLVRVRDDGEGMSADDARLCLERHATSKLEDARGLHRVVTFGFRGEALPSIASVARLTLTTCEPGALEGTRVVVEGGRLVRAESCGAPQGTTVEVQELFFNTPARRKFLRRPETEQGHALEWAVRLALARPEVGFTVRADGRELWRAGAGDARERASAALGSEAARALFPVEGGAGEVRVRGWACGPDFSTGSSRSIYTYVNGRFVRDRGVLAAVQRAFSEVLPHGRSPAVVLFVELPPERVDVNVHPQKLEVRFADGRSVFDAVMRSLSAPLARGAWLGDGAIAPGAPPSEARAAAVREAVEQYVAAAHPERGYGPDLDRGHRPDDLVLPFEPRASKRALYFSGLRYLGQLHRTYLVCESPEGLLLVDQHAAHERAAYERLRASAREAGPRGQALLFPETVSLAPAEARGVTANLERIRELGFEIEPVGGAAFVLRAVPAPLADAHADWRSVLADVAAELDAHGAARALDAAMDEVYATLACHTSVRARDALQPEEAHALLRSVDGTPFGTRCPHGRPVVVEISTPELEKRFGRDYPGIKFGGGSE
jgi:DNA mismatch repair protein MutL